MSATMTPSIAAPTAATTLPPAAGTPAAAGGSSSGFSFGKGVNTLNQFLKDYEPLISTTQQGASMLTADEGGSPPQAIQMPGLPALTPPPQIDRLAFLRAFGMQG
jgi:hypothetical protein